MIILKETVSRIFGRGSYWEQSPNVPNLRQRRYGDRSSLARPSGFARTGGRGGAETVLSVS